MEITAAIIATTVLVCLSVFQLALALGAPLGRYAWGGAHTVLPRNLRIGSTMSILLYAVFASFILSSAGLIETIDNQSVVTVGMWVCTAYFTVGIVMNAISRSVRERLVMTPVCILLAITFLICSL